MEDITNKQAYMPFSKPPPSPSPLAIHKNSQTITKAKPKIRIIHIFAPEIIKTDVANFRELVQRLTGKPTHQDLQKGTCKKIRSSRTIPKRGEEPQAPPKKVEVMRSGGFVGSLDHQSCCRERVKEEEEEMWNGASSGGFLNGFGDFDGFIQELGEFPLLPMDASHHMHAFEETQLA
ncbi:hypothetical protein Dsin_007085 [Dipteronia sinensis]|uniref:VQ domain-containing protein n=1 Tax=Dipteronia sinensis TaxID=43782 RepID=A0AAE0B0H3_9ROSI|nr:hypothetical protein Dsin_007085 [Dipteronia sinensis]